MGLTDYVHTMNFLSFWISMLDTLISIVYNSYRVVHSGLNIEQPAIILTTEALKQIDIREDLFYTFRLTFVINSYLTPKQKAENWPFAALWCFISRVIGDRYKTPR